MAAPAYHTGTNNGSNSATSIAMTVPGTVVAGELMIASIQLSASGRTCTPPAGWLRCPHGGGHAGVNGHYSYYKFATSSDAGASLTWSFSGAALVISAAMATFTGVNTTTPFMYGRMSQTTFAGDVTIQGGVASVADGLLLSVAGASGGSLSNTNTAFTTGAAANWTRRDQRDQTGIGHTGAIIATNSANVASINYPTAAGATTWSLGGSTGIAASNALVLVPATQTAAWLMEPSGGRNAGSTTASCAVGSGHENYVVPGVLYHMQIGISSKAVTFTSAVFTSGITCVTNGALYDAATLNLRLQAYKAYFTEADCWSVTTEAVTVTVSGAVNFAANSVMIGGFPSTVSLQDLQRVDTGANSTAPDPASAACADNSVVVVDVASENGNVVPGAGSVSSGYTFLNSQCNTSIGKYGCLEEGLVLGTGGTTTNPGALNAMANVRWISSTFVYSNLYAPINSVAPVNSGTPTENDLLSVTTGTWTANPPTITYTYQWQRDCGSGYITIPGATASSYTLVSADVGCMVRCLVTATNSFGATSVASNALGPVAIGCDPTVNLTAPVVTGTTCEGSVLTSTPGTWDGDPLSFAITYQWKRDCGSGYITIPGAVNPTYTLTAADVGCTIRCAVTAFNGCVVPATTNSNATGTIVGIPANTVAPVIAGTAFVGHTLVLTSPGTWTNSPTYTYQWLRNGSVIAGETTTSYILQVADEGASVQCRVGAHNVCSV